MLELIPENMGDIHDIFENLTESSVEFLSQYTDEELKIITGFIKHSTEFAANYAKQLRKAKDKQTKKAPGPKDDGASLWAGAFTHVFSAEAATRFAAADWPGPASLGTPGKEYYSL